MDKIIRILVLVSAVVFSFSLSSCDIDGDGKIHYNPFDSDYCYITADTIESFESFSGTPDFILTYYKDTMYFKKYHINYCETSYGFNIKNIVEDSIPILTVTQANYIQHILLNYWIDSERYVSMLSKIHGNKKIEKQKQEILLHYSIDSESYTGSIQYDMIRWIDDNLHRGRLFNGSLDRDTLWTSKTAMSIDKWVHDFDFINNK